MSELRDEIRADLAKRCLEMLDAGTVPWRKPWQGEGGLPVNVQTGKRYQGMNSILLLWAGHTYWAGYGQWKKLGGQVQKGEHGTEIWRPARWATVKDAAGKERRIPTRFTLCKVFNSGQQVGWNAPAVKVNDVQPNHAAEMIVDAMPNRPTIDNVLGDRACYYPLLDKITMPKPEQFESAESYYSVLFHELSHSTGHASRCNRDGMGDMTKHAYSREELVAEFGSLFLCAECNIAMAVIANSASYIRTWRDRIANAPEILDDVINDAQRAANYVLTPKAIEVTEVA